MSLIYPIGRFCFDTLTFNKWKIPHPFVMICDTGFLVCFQRYLSNSFEGEGLCCVVSLFSSTMAVFNRTRSSSASSLFSLPSIPRLHTEKGNFHMTHFDCPVDSQMEHASTNSVSTRLSTIKAPRITIVANTYKMEPDKTFKVAEIRIRNIIKKWLELLKSERYEAKRSREISKMLSNSIMKEVKLLGLSRFKFVCTVSIGQMKGQTTRIASRCIWDTEFDSFVTERMENDSVFAVGTVYGLYQE